MNDTETVFHITHHKAGSQWVAEVLKYSALDRAISQKPLAAQLYENPIRRGGVYLSNYVNRPDLETLLGESTQPVRKLVVVRDLRDTLVSLYFSLLFSHVLIHDRMRMCRDHLSRLCKEEGLLYLMGDEKATDIYHEMMAIPGHERISKIQGFNTREKLLWMSTIMTSAADIQSSWRGADALYVRYEDLIADEIDMFQKIIAYCNIRVDRNTLEAIVVNNSFEKKTGRKPGQEHVSSHQRKGVSGDWRNHFSPSVKSVFKNMFGAVLIENGYERDMQW